MPAKKKPRRKAFLYQKGNFESMRKDASNLAKGIYFNGYSDNRSFQENFDLITYLFRSLLKSISPQKPVGRPLLFLGYPLGLEERFLEEIGHMLRLKRLAVAN